MRRPIWATINGGGGKATDKRFRKKISFAQRTNNVLRCGLYWEQLLETDFQVEENVHDSCWHRLSVWWMVVMVFRIIVCRFFPVSLSFPCASLRAPLYAVSLSWMIHQIRRTQKHCHQILCGVKIVGVVGMITITGMDGEKVCIVISERIFNRSQQESTEMFYAPWKWDDVAKCAHVKCRKY